MANENVIQLPADDAGGKKLRAITTNLGSGNHYMEVITPTYGSGTIVDLATPFPVVTRPTTTPGLIGGAFFSATSVSGGVALTSAAVREVRIKAQHFNSGEIYVGSNISTGVHPTSGVGYLLRPDEYIDVEIDQLGKVFLFGQISGYCHVTYAGKV